ncbi:GNAT family N-acetyltransferase [Streptomyces aidingensis]|uniref:Predicted acetyltransferase n=1 Tax=Streptomyces aidingensis TaxID=910347 RepID=A0A1I1FQH0_9ACTN|nr:GNAT family N-acetyltransferase [Streptomyces aidingensis]SFB99230.1 Predicted acetyltransferase [Streptomyces aidingensis]
MPELSEPDTAVHASFLAAMKEFEAEGRTGDGSMIGRDLATWSGRWHEPGAFAAYVAAVRADVLEETPRPRGHVPCTTLWWTEDGEWLGRLAIRHRLNRLMLEFAGHIGYDVRPSARRRGHGTAMLRAALPAAHRMGIEAVLVTCDDDNDASRRIIEHCGGRFEDQRGKKLRYWIDTAAA